MEQSSNVGTAYQNNDTLSTKAYARSVGGSGGGPGAFDVDVNGGLEPASTVNTDTYWEYDVNGDLQPKVI